MTAARMSIFIDLSLVFRVCAGFCWGFVFAVFLRRHPAGDYLATQREEFAAAVGMAVNMAIAFGTGWASILVVSVASLLGFLLHQFVVNVTPEAPQLGAYKTVWVLEDGIAITGNIIERLHDTLENGYAPTKVSRTLLQAIRLLGLLKAARNGRYEPQ